MGHTLHFCPALLGEMEKYPVFCLDLAGMLLESSSRSPEEACIQMFREAKRNTPSILYLPNIEVWWTAIGRAEGSVLQTLFMSLINELLPQTDLLLLASCTVQPGATVDETLPTELLTLFPDDKARFGVAPFAEDERKAFFEDVIRHAGLPPPSLHKQQMYLERGLGTRTRSSQRKQVTAVTLVPEALEKAKVLNEHEKKELLRQDSATLRQLRMYLRSVLNELLSDKKFTCFRDPIDGEEIDDYYDVIKEPMDLNTMMDVLNDGGYESTDAFLADVQLIKDNAVRYNRPEVRFATPPPPRAPPPCCRINI